MVLRKISFKLLQKTAPSQMNSEDKGQPLIEHLIELRGRLLRSFLAILVVFVCLFIFANSIYELSSQPLRDMLPEGSSMIATGVASPFLAPMKLCIYLAIFASAPYFLYQIWAFVAPGLYKNEKRFALPMFVSSVILFYAGMVFAYFVVFPLIFGFFTTIGPESVAVMTDIDSYLAFVMKLFFAFGLAFQIPIATMLLIKTGFTTRQSLAKKRPYLIVGCFVVGMLMTPPDIFSQVLLAIPMWALFEAGLLLSILISSPAKETKTEDASNAAAQE